MDPAGRAERGRAGTIGQVHTLDRSIRSAPEAADDDPTPLAGRRPRVTAGILCHRNATESLYRSPAIRFAAREPP